MVFDHRIQDGAMASPDGVRTTARTENRQLDSGGVLEDINIARGTDDTSR